MLYFTLMLSFLTVTQINLYNKSYFQGVILRSSSQSFGELHPLKGYQIFKQDVAVYKVHVLVECRL